MLESSQKENYEKWLHNNIKFEFLRSSIDIDKLSEHYGVSFDWVLCSACNNWIDMNSVYGEKFSISSSSAPKLEKDWAIRTICNWRKCSMHVFQFSCCKISSLNFAIYN